MFPALLLLAVCFQGFGEILAQNALMTGKISSKSGEALPYASVFVKNSTFGSVSNSEGNYSLEVSPGKYVIVVKYIGYKLQEKQFDLKPGTLRADFVMEEEEIEIQEVVITDKEKDPAYAIIRKAIENKEKNQIQAKNYSFTTYSKSTVRNEVLEDTTEGGKALKNLSDKLADDEDDKSKKNKKKKDKEEKEDSTYSEKGIAYLEENITEVFIKEPDQRKENIISTRVSGKSDEVSFLGNIINRILDFSPYTNIIPFEGVTPKGIISPIANSAFLYYDYQLLGTVRQDGRSVYKIKVIPKRVTDPVFSGIIYIMDQTYGVRELDLCLTRLNQLLIFDTLLVKQDFVPANDSVWVPFMLSYDMFLKISILGSSVGLKASTQSISRNYVFEPEFEKKLFNNQIITFGDSAILRDTSYWEKNRPVPLKEDEVNDYIEKDSLAIVEKSPEYLDSLTKKSRKFKPAGFIFLGYHYHNYSKKFKLDIPSPLMMVSYNTMEGCVINPRLSVEWEFKNQKTFKIEPEVRYGFANQKISYRLGVESRLNRIRKERISAEAGDYVHEFSPFAQISPFQNMLWTLFLKKNYLRLYQIKYGTIEYTRELFNGFKAQITAFYESRTAMPNSTEYSWSKSSGAYAPNIDFPSHNALLTEISLEYTIANKYIKTPKYKINLGSKWPILRFSWMRGTSGILGSTANFDKIRGEITSENKLGMVGRLEWSVSGGAFLNSKAVYFPDYQHFKGNQTAIRMSGLRQFYLMPYYSASTLSYWAVAHAEHAFQGFLFNKIPGIKRLKLYEYVGVHYLWTPESGHYLEMNFGLERKFLRDFLPLRVDFHLKILGAFGNRFGGTFTWSLDQLMRRR